MSRRAEARESQRPRILGALLELVAEQGYPSVTVAQVARTAGVSLSSFYEHFPDKESCLLGAYDDVATELHRAVRAPREVRAGVLAYLAWFEAHPQAAATFVLAVHTAGEAAVRRRLEVLDGFRRLFAVAVGSGPDDDLTTLSVVTTLDAFVHDRLVRGQITDLGLRAEALADLVVAIVGARVAA